MGILERWSAQTPPPLPPELAGERTGYRRFIVLSSPRSGSSLLIQSLRSHPRIVSYGELFNRKRIGFNTPGLRNRDRGLQRMRDRRPAQFLSDVVFRGYADHVEAVGFKIFYEHLERAGLEPLGRRLVEMPALHVIHLRRANLLRARLSNVIALKTGVWGIQSPAQRRDVRVRLDPEDCRRYFVEMSDLAEKYGAAFAGHPTLAMTYEALAAGIETERERIQRFLGVEPAALHARTIKQEVRPLSAAIENLEELERAFRDTPWHRFFDDGAP